MVFLLHVKMLEQVSTFLKSDASLRFIENSMKQCSNLALLLRTIYAIDRIIAAILKFISFRKHIPRIHNVLKCYLLTFLIRNGHNLRCLHWNVHRKFTHTIRYKYPRFCKKSKIWLISGLKSLPCSTMDGKYHVLMFICPAHNIHWTLSIWKHSFLIKI